MANEFHGLEGINKSFYVQGELADQADGEAIKRMLRLVTGCDCIPLEGSTGHAADGDWDEGDVDFYCCDDHLGYTLSYNYRRLGCGLCHVFETAVSGCEQYDHCFDLTMDNLRELLSKMAESGGYDMRTLRAVGGKYGILV